LEWLRANVGAFGGDPERIVLMGESAGSGTVAHLLATAPPSGSSSGNLGVAGAILQSGAVAGALDAATAASVDDLRDTPIDALLAAQDQTVEAALAKVGMMPFHPWVDDDLLTAS